VPVRIRTCLRGSTRSNASWRRTRTRYRRVVAGQKVLALAALGQDQRAVDMLTSLTASVGDSVSAYAKAHLALAWIRGRSGGPMTIWFRPPYTGAQH
jgi:hypothetical protein